MKSRYLWVVVLAAVVGSALLTATAAASAAAILGGSEIAVAQEPQGPPPDGRPHGRGGPGGPGGPGGLDRMVFELDLTQAQIEQVKALRESARTASEPYEQQMRKAEDAIRATVESGSFDEDAVRTLAAGGSKASIELRVIRARTDAAILKLLTADQREALRTIRHPRPGRGPGLPF